MADPWRVGHSKHRGEVDGQQYARRRVLAGKGNGAMYHNSEANVVRSSALYLLHPVNQALSMLVGTDKMLCPSEITNNKIRSDITYYRDAGNAG